MMPAFFSAVRAPHGLRAIIILLTILVLRVPSGAQVVYSNNFETSNTAGWSSSSISTTPGTASHAATKFLGEFNGGGGAGNSVTLSLAGLPSHTSVTVTYDLYVIRSWDGNGEAGGGADHWLAAATGGPVLTHTTFGNYNGVTQSFQGPWTGPYALSPRYPAGYGAAELNTLGYTFNGTPMDSVYHMTQTFIHFDPRVDLHFTGYCNEDVGNESWGLDNVVVTVNGPALPALTSVYSNNFETSNTTGWSSSSISTTPGTVNHPATKFLGEFDGNGGAGRKISLALSSLPSHSFAFLQFDFYALRSWDGNGNLGGAPDPFYVAVSGGPTLVSTTIANFPGDTQSFPGPWTGAVNGYQLFPNYYGSYEANTLGYTFGGNPMDSVYRFVIPFAHTGSTLGLDFTGACNQDPSDESWGLDNVQVYVVPDGQVASLTLTPGTAPGGSSAKGVLTLKSAPTVDTLISLTKFGLPHATVPKTVKVLAGKTTAAFSVKTLPLFSSESGLIYAAYGGGGGMASLTVRPPGPKALTVTPSPIPSGGTADLKVVLQGKAGPGAVSVTLTSNNTAIRFTGGDTTTVVAIPAGVTNQTFTGLLHAATVTAKTVVHLTATVNGLTYTKSVTVTP